MEGEERDASFDDIVARSNLVPTAGEFVPKSKMGRESGREYEESPGDDGQRFREEGIGNSYGYYQGSSEYDFGACGGGGGGTDFREHAGESEGSESFGADGAHSSNWRMQMESGGEVGPGRRRPSSSFWANRYPKYPNSKGGDKWSKRLLNHAEERRSAEEGHPRGEESYLRSATDANGTARPRYKQKQSLYDKFPSHVRSYIRNGTTYYKNQGWASIPQASGASSSDHDNGGGGGGGGAHDYREYKSRSFGARSGDQYDVDEDSFGRRKPPGKAAIKAKRDEEPGKNGKAKGKEESRTGKDKTNKTNQRERLIDLLTRGVLECLVCCEQVHQNASVWSCSNCYHVLHLRCIVKWAKSSKSDFGWRCPACQNVTRQVPFGYFCFCGKIRDPEWNRSDCPHSCGEVCGRTQKKSCSHKCILLCHPGPCPQCTATVVKSCGCQKTQISVQCFSSDAVTCGTVCGNLLNCKVHTCQNICHMETCADCKEYVHQACFCGKETRDVSCTADTAGVEKYSCEKICGLKLSCGSHFCDSICHEGECKKCDLLPEAVKLCPCGKTEISSLGVEERKSCEDPIPTCELICGKELVCGQPGNRHTCQSACHEGPCPVCPLETVVKCRCGHMDKMLPCSELLVRADDARCSKRCIKKRSCGKHKCNQTCCIDIDHICPLPCNRMLQCSLHRCEETCHRGHCRPCWRASFEELYCECGAEVIYPPVPCGTRRPPCSRPCTRTHNCEHAPTHNCHSGNQCPPCTVLTKKYCHGRHELRKAVPCHQDTFSCGLPCNKELSCGRHKCILPCHDGSCLKEGQSCAQPCKTPRTVCSHACGAPCHDGPCPTDLPCKEMVKVTCECGHRYVTRACHDNAKEYHRIATAELASKMADLQAGQTIDLDDMIADSKKMSFKTLECNDECRLIERNRRLAIALQIRNPDLSAKLTPRYSDFMRHWAKKDARFCQMVHDKLTDLVQLAKQSKQKSRSFSFDPMNREKRQFVHEYCEHFGCKSMAYDPEPKRNVVATALRDKSWLPCMSLLEVIQRESWPRKVPAPVNVKMTALPKTSQRTMEVLPLRSSKNQSSTNSESNNNNNNNNNGSSSNNNNNNNNNNNAGTATGATTDDDDASQSTSQIDYFDWQPTTS